MSNFHKIADALEHYDPDSKISIAEQIFDKDEYMLTWTINELCNFNCDYCGQYNKEHPDTGKYSPDYIKNCFDKTGKIWHIIVTGGETFLYPDFINLIAALSDKHYISINTNLSTKNVFEFADKINPERIILINAGIHIREREKSTNGLDLFLEKFLYLQNKGFNIAGSYVVFPDMIDRIEKDIEFLKEKGMKNICAKSFSGDFQNKKYPASYSALENNLINKYSNSSIELPAYREFTNFQKRICSSGSNFLAMDASGNLSRCLSVKEKMGNFFSGEYSFNKNAKPCSVNECVCPYQGMLFSKNEEIKGIDFFKIFRKK